MSLVLVLFYLALHHLVPHSLNLPASWTISVLCVRWCVSVGDSGAQHYTLHP